MPAAATSTRRRRTLPRNTEPKALVSERKEHGNGIPVISTRNVRKTFHQDGHDVRAVEDITFNLAPGETLGLVGESGSGKTTLARLLLGLTAPDEGSVVELEGTAVEAEIHKRDREEVRALQIVFQNPDAALNRRFTIQRIIARALHMLVGGKREEMDTRLRDLAHSVRFDTRLIRAKPSQLSGGLKQRAAIARAFAGDPKVVVCDEPTSALDVSVQAAILNLLAELQVEEDTAYLFISHDLGVVRYLSDRIAVLYLGRLMELGSGRDRVLLAPPSLHRGAAVDRAAGGGQRAAAHQAAAARFPATPIRPPGCVFHTRCPRYIGDICKEEEPELKEVEPGHFWRCHYSVEDLRELQKTAPPEREDRESEGSCSGRSPRGSEPRVLRVSNKPAPGPSEDKS